MTPEVQASIIMVANDWAVLITKLSPPIRGRYLGELVENFRVAYERVRQVVEEVSATSG